MPTGFTATGGDGRVELAWTAANANGSPVSAYRILRSQRLASGWGPWVATNQPAAAGTRASVTGLVNGATYVFHIAAVNAAGTGTNSRAMVATPATVPDAPTSVLATPLGGRVKLAWTAPVSNGGAAVSGYVVEYSANAGLTWRRWSMQPTTPALTLNDLQNGTVHLFRVAAKNAVGIGGFSAPSGPVDPAGPPFPKLPEGAGGTDRNASRLFTTTASGLEYRMLRRGSGALPAPTDEVTVRYHGWLDDGTVFDSSYDKNETPSFRLSVVIPGWREGVRLVREGGMIELTISSRLGYGSRGIGKIPPKATLHFLVELVDTRKPS
ncbi:MAG: FKBP-type peptidyl-prolyl cis-trans isomerase [Planctomycetia bacterium]